MMMLVLLWPMILEYSDFPKTVIYLFSVPLFLMLILHINSTFPNLINYHYKIPTDQISYLKEKFKDNQENITFIENVYKKYGYISKKHLIEELNFTYKTKNI